ncbi:amino acid adenylation domain-containing protein [Dactylosporangium sp. NPDC051484]|uniref:non-ribosomal peptide synthetase/type I polyketide synthase n=1 Tax=Dactylosporangium sp. NPDC051484 TaxID=3154942 RepID=UPI00344B3697
MTSSLNERIEQALRDLGDGLAVVAADSTGRDVATSGTELAARAGAVAALAAVVRSGRSVAVLAHRSADTLAAMLGCLAAGVPWLPLDPDLPDGQLVERLRRTGAGLLLVSSTSAARAERIAPAAGIGWAAADAAGEGPATAAPGRAAGGLAYLIQTSGTTGAPKTIGVPLSALESYLAGILPVLGGLERLRGRRIGVVTTLAADLGYTTVFAGLLAGAQLHLVPRPVAQDPAAFAAYQRRHRLDAYKTTPSHLRALLAADPSGDFLPTELLVCGGEAFTPDLVEGLVRAGARCRVVNHYGPAETCIGVAAGAVALAPRAGGEPALPVGPALHEVRLRVVDEHLRDVPAGTSGEILIAGPQLSWGYLGAPEQTAERFVADPGGHGRRAYRTGDRGLLTEHGELVVLGRIDRQRKVRGHRVEPAGVEAALRRLPGVRDAAADVRPVGDLGDTLVAWVAADGVSAAELQARLAERLPAHEVPSRILVRAALPRTVNGKVDTAALALDQDQGSDAGSARIDRLGGVFAAVLGSAPVDPDADLFGLGLHSLAAVRAVARVHRAGLGELSVRQVHEARTVRALDRLLDPGDDPVTGPASGPVTDAGPPVTGFEPQQHALWLERARLGPGSAYDIPLHWTLTGPADLATLRGAVERVVEAHPALRTRGVLDGDVPRAVRHDEPVPVRTVDLSALAAGAQDAAVDDLLRELRAELGAAAGPLRAAVVRRSPVRHELLVAVDHAVFDGPSADVFVAAVLAVATGGDPPAPTGHPRRPPAARGAAPRLPAPPGLALDHPAGAAIGAIRVVADLPDDLWDRVRRCAADLGVSVFALTVSVWAAVLGRQEGDRAFVVATPVDLREDHGIDPARPAIGCFVNTVPVVVEPDESATVPALCAKTAGAVAAALDDRLRPYAEHSARMRADHATAQPARVMVTVERAPTHRAGVLAAVPRAVPAPRPTVDLDLVVTEYDDAPATVALHVAAGAGDRARADALLDQLAAGLAAVCLRPGQRVGDLELLSDRWRSRLLAWGTGDPASPRDDAVAPVRRHGRARPDDVAAVTPEGAWTYGALLRLVDVYRAGLAAAGVAPGGHVGVAVPRSVELVALWLAVLESGAAVVALDPHWPAERIAQAVTAGRLDLLVADRPEAATECPTVRPAQLTEAGRHEGPPAPVAATATAYVILTSGSTGVPGAVAVSRAALAGHLGWVDAEFALTPDDRVLLHTSPGFDVAVWELLGPLGRGAPLVVAPPAQAADVEGLARLVRAERVSVLQTVPALLQALLEQPDFVAAEGLRLVFCGGEEVPPGLVAQSHRLLPAVTLVNAYGPTETTVDATRRVTLPGDGSLPRVPIGRPIGGATARVIDDVGRLLPPGAVGELAIGGAGVANGYLNDPARTAARFVPDPYGTRPGARLFRTGDRVRWTSDGQLDFLGRRDNQVQLRGQRVELEEVEAALTSHLAVREAAVAVAGSGRDARLVARLVLTGEPAVAELRRHLAARLPVAAVPAEMLLVPALPRLPNGKVDRAAAARLTGRPLTAPATTMTAAEARVADVWAAVLGTRPGNPHVGFFDAGGNSLLILRLRARLAEAFGTAPTVTDLFEHPTVQAQAAFLSGAKPQPASIAPVVPGGDPGFAVAVIGMACRTPVGRTPAEFWAAVRDGVSAARRFTAAELVAAGVPEELADDPQYVPVCAPLDDPYDFDAAFFRLADDEARLVSPQHRLLLDCAWEALESAGVLARPGNRRIGVFAGSSEESHGAGPDAGGLDQAERIAWELGTNQDFLATRVSHLLDLRGPALSVRTACSTSLVAVHLAVQALAAGECDTALAGGVALRHPVRRGHRYEEGGIYSRDGHCRPYDHAAGGIVSGDGAGIVVLKPLAAALADGDHIHAVIRGSAVNNDGAAKTGFTAPSVGGQVEVVRAAFARASIDPGTVGYVEGHGTGTALGDPIEVTALTRVWRESSDAVGVCSLGSLKANIGHTDAAAGVLGLIKACLAVEHGVLPGIPTLREPNPSLRLAESPFVVHRESRAWPTGDGPRRAAVHALGLGGTNAHVVVEQAIVEPRPASPLPDVLVVPLSAPDAVGVDGFAAAFAAALSSDVDGAAAAAATLRRSRSTFAVRRAEVGADPEQVRTALRRPRGPVTAGNPAVVLMFPGGGSHRPGSGSRLFETVAPFHDELLALADPVRRLTGRNLRELLWGSDSELLAQPSFGFVANTAYGLAVARALRTFGVPVAGVVGYSLGELPAAALAGVFDAEDMLRIAALRGDIFERVGGGSTYVAAGADRVAPLLDGDLVVAVVSGPQECVVSGSLAALTEFERRLTERGVDHRRVAVPGAVHSPLLDPFLDEYRDLVARIGPAEPTVALYSNVTGAVLSTATSPDYWARQLRGTVRFGQCLASATATGDTVLVDVGPGRGLTTIAQGAAPGVSVSAVAGGSRDERPEDVHFARCLADLWERGVPIDWTPSRHRDVPVPVVPLRRRPLLPPRPAGRPVTSARLWERGWQRIPVRPGRPAEPPRLVLLGDGGPEHRAWADALGTVTAARTAAEAWQQAGAGWVVDLRPLAGSARVGDLLELLDAAPPSGARVCVVVAGACDVLGVERLEPYAALAAPAGLTVRQERPGVQVVTFDAGDTPAAPGLLARVLSRPEVPAVLAARGTTLWQPMIMPVPEVPSGADGPLRRHGVYLITGGLGRYGRWLAECLAREAAATVILLQRTGLDAAGEEGERRRRAVDRITAAGGRVEVHALDVTDEPALRALLDDVEQRHGAVHGVIHCAGDITSPASFAALDDLVGPGLADAVRAQSAAKVAGSEVLRRLLRGRDLDFCVLMSSNAALLGGPGLALYGPVNAYQHVLAQQERRDAAPWVAIGWDGWRLPEDTDAAPQRSSLEELALPGREAFEALLRCIRSELGSVFVSRGDLAARYGNWVPPTDAVTDERVDDDPAPATGGDDVTAAVRTLWKELVGAADPGPDDDLFDLGGTSLTVMRMRARLRDRLGVDVPLAALMEHRTVAAMAGLVAATTTPAEVHAAPEEEEEADIFTILSGIASPTAGHDDGSDA